MRFSSAASTETALSHIYEIDPLLDPRWEALVNRDERASIFHHPAWLEALHRTYGYRPVVLTTSGPEDELKNGVVFCEVDSWLTGRRLVSLPFSDHCEPLANSSEFHEISIFLQASMRAEKLRYVECRPLHLMPQPVIGCQSAEFAFHTIDLRRSKEQLFEGLHKDSIRRKVQRASRESLVCRRGASPEFVRNFYRLFVMTRRRHGLPPTPYRWFSTLVQYLGERAQIYLALKNEIPVAGLFMLRHGKKFVYKYGGSDQSVRNLGGTPFLFWKAIEDGKSEGFEQLDLGRSDLDNEGLITFKNRLGGQMAPLRYWRLSDTKLPKSSPGWMSRFAKQALAHSPDVVRIQLGNMLYRHLG